MKFTYVLTISRFVKFVSYFFPLAKSQSAAALHVEHISSHHVLVSPSSGCVNSGSEIEERITSVCMYLVAEAVLIIYVIRHVFKNKTARQPDS